MVTALVFGVIAIVGAISIAHAQETLQRLAPIFEPKESLGIHERRLAPIFEPKESLGIDKQRLAPVRPAPVRFCVNQACRNLTEDSCEKIEFCKSP